MGDVKETIAKNILFYRKKLKLSQKELAQRIGVNNSAISNWENGINSIDIETLFKVCKTLNISIDTVFGVDKESEITPHEQATIDKYRDTDEPGKEVVDLVLEKEHERTVAQRGESKVVPINKENEEEPAVKYALPKYDIPASAGTGEYLDYSECETVELDYPPPEGASFIIQVKGDSMEPTYYDGDLVFIRSQPTINRGEVGVFYHDGQSYIKTLGRDILISRNPKYRPIHMNETTRCFGKVVGVYITDPAVHNTKMYRVARDYRLQHGGGEITDVTLKRNILKQNEIVKKEGQIIDFEDN